MLKGLGDFMNMLGQARDIHKNFKEIQEKAARIRVSASAGAGMVEVIASGDQKIHNIKINRELFDPRDLDMLEELIISGVNEALDKAKIAVAENMKQLTKNLNLTPEMENQLKDLIR